jgi:hypothetical protein
VADGYHVAVGMGLLLESTLVHGRAYHRLLLLLLGIVMLLLLLWKSLMWGLRLLVKLLVHLRLNV